MSHIHFIGIGGIGVSSLAKYYLSSGNSVSGSDLKSSEITAELKESGIKIIIGNHQGKNIPPETNLVIHTPAIKTDNPEILEARKRKLSVLSYPEALGELTRKYKTVTVSGSHGKSTTTAMSALVLEEGYFDPTVIIGTKIKEFGNSNFRKGLGTYLLLEADEWNKSFLNYHPFIAVVTNIDVEHLDTYKNVENVEKSFEEYLRKVPADGKIIANTDDARLKKIAGKFSGSVIWYSLKQREAKKIREILKIPGEHNVSNALAALTLGRVLGIHEPDILRALERFQGAWRRFEFKGMVKGAFVYTDYGHHPTEIKATIKAAREKFPMRRIWCVYQPHQYQRLSYLWKDFITSFDLADIICFLPVYDVAGRETEQAKSEVNSEKLAQEVGKRDKKVEILDSNEHAVKYIKANAKKGDVILIMGAGDIYEIFENNFVEE